MRNELGEITVLSIAHRLHTIAFYDKASRNLLDSRFGLLVTDTARRCLFCFVRLRWQVLVMKSGEVAEFDAPYSLLQNQQSIFYSMCERSGDFAVIYETAQSAFQECRQ